MTFEEMMTRRAYVLDGLTAERQRDYITQWRNDAAACRESRRVTRAENTCDCFCCQFDRLNYVNNTR